MNRVWFFVVFFVAFLAGFGAYRLRMQSRSEPLALDTNATIGFIGCSNTSQSVMGYRLSGGAAMWKIPDSHLHDYDSGTVLDWADTAGEDNKFWKKFDEYLAANPNTKKIWWQLCVPREGMPSLENALRIVAATKTRIPNVTLYVSPLPSYTDNVCRITGIDGLARGKALAKEIAAESDIVELGPELAPHEKSEINEDGCHLNETGMRNVGEQLEQFFINTEKTI
jgi:hypothetical protein